MLSPVLFLIKKRFFSWMLMYCKSSIKLTKLKMYILYSVLTISFTKIHQPSVVEKTVQATGMATTLSRLSSKASLRTLTSGRQSWQYWDSVSVAFACFFKEGSAIRGAPRGWTYLRTTTAVLLLARYDLWCSTVVSDLWQVPDCKW